MKPAILLLLLITLLATACSQAADSLSGMLPGEREEAADSLPTATIAPTETPGLEDASGYARALLFACLEVFSKRRFNLWVL